MNKNLIKLLVTVVVVLLLMVLFSNVLKKEKIGVGEKVPNFSLEDVTGKNHVLDDYEGELIFLNFFASWCKPCIDEAEELESFVNEHGDEIVFFVVDRAEPRDVVKDYIQQNKSNLMYLMDYNNEIAKLFNIVGQPETILIDRNGIVREHIKGPVDEEKLEYILEKWNNQ